MSCIYSDSNIYALQNQNSKYIYKSYYLNWQIWTSRDVDFPAMRRRCANAKNQNIYYTYVASYCVPCPRISVANLVFKAKSPRTCRMSHREIKSSVREVTVTKARITRVILSCVRCARWKATVASAFATASLSLNSS